MERREGALRTVLVLVGCVMVPGIRAAVHHRRHDLDRAGFEGKRPLVLGWHPPNRNQHPKRYGHENRNQQRNAGSSQHGKQLSVISSDYQWARLGTSGGASRSTD